MSKSKQRTHSDAVAQKGMNAVEAIFLDMKWLFRRQSESDFGIDAQVEVVDQCGDPTGQLVALQIKSGPAYFRQRGADFCFYGKPRHLEYWDNHSLPVIIVLYDPDADVAIWQRIERHLVRVGAGGRWSIDIPRNQTLTANSREAIISRLPSSDPESLRRNQMSFDLPLIRKMAAGRQAYARIQEWVNKGLNFRAASICFDEYDAEPDHEVRFFMRASNPSRVFDWLFPWVDFSYVDMPEEDGEVMEHIFEINLNEIGRSFLSIEDYYVNGRPSKPDVEITRPTGEIWCEEKFFQYEFEQAQRDDWAAEAFDED